jgi:hypothetical protein
MTHDGARFIVTRQSYDLVRQIVEFAVRLSLPKARRMKSRCATPSMRGSATGTSPAANPHVVRRDGTDLRKLADLGGYQSHILFLDVPDFHSGSSDLPIWSTGGKSVFYTAKVDDNVELFQVTLDGAIAQLTKSKHETLHYHPNPSPDGKWLLYGSKRDGVRQL